MTRLLRLEADGWWGGYQTGPTGCTGIASSTE